MSSSKIIRLSSHSKRTDDLVSMLRNDNHFVTLLDKISTTADKITSQDVVLIIINYSSIVSAERKELTTLFQSARSKKFVIFDVPNDATRRQAFYRLGAYRIFRDSYEITDIFHFATNTLRKLETNGKLKEAHFSGSLQDFSLAGLINIFGREKRSGILRIRTNGSTGKIYFSDGNIVRAGSGNLGSDDAIFYMLTWTKGWFSMRPLPIKPFKSQIQLSNLGILLYGEQIANQYSDQINKLGGINRQLRVINQGDILQPEKDKIFVDFIQYLLTFRKIHEVVEFSPYALLETLDILEKLNGSKNLEFRETVSGIGEIYVEKAQKKTITTEHIFKAGEVKKLRKILSAKNLSGGKLLILGINTCGKTDFIRNFTHGSHGAVRTNQDLDFTKVDLDTDFHVQVFGLVIDKRLMEIVEKLSEGLLGYIFLVDAENPDEFEYTSYIITHLTNLFDVPWTIAVTNIDVKNVTLLKKIKSDIRVPDKRNLLICDVTNKDEVKKTILSMAITSK